MVLEIRTILSFIMTATCSLLTFAVGADGAAEPVPWGDESVMRSEPPPPESLQFQFLIGDWAGVAERYDVISGKLLATVDVHIHDEYRDEKRMVFSEWAGYSPDTKQRVRYGITLRTFLVNENEWNHAFLGSHIDGTSSFKVHKVGEEMIGFGEFEYPPGRVIKYRIRFFDITENSYEWEQKVSLDGENWRLQRRYSAKRRSN